MADRTIFYTVRSRTGERCGMSRATGHLQICRSKSCYSRHVRYADSASSYFFPNGRAGLQQVCRIIQLQIRRRRHVVSWSAYCADEGTSCVEPQVLARRERYLSDILSTKQSGTLPRLWMPFAKSGYKIILVLSRARSIKRIYMRTQSRANRWTDPVQSNSYEVWLRRC